MTDGTLVDAAARWANIIYVAWICITVIVSVVAVFMANQRAAARDSELQRVRAELEQQVAASTRRTAELNAAAAEVQAEAAAAARDQEELRKRNTELLIELEQERRLKLEAERAQLAGGALANVESAPREITSEQQEALAARLAEFADTRVGFLELVDPEASRLAFQLRRALNDARWAVAVSSVGSLVPPQYGIICTHVADDRAASALIEMLRSFNFVVYERSGEIFQIIVGLAPPR